MKKTYIQPSLEAVKLNIPMILSGSPVLQLDDETTVMPGTTLSPGFEFNFEE